MYKDISHFQWLTGKKLVYIEFLLKVIDLFIYTIYQSTVKNFLALTSTWVLRVESILSRFLLLTEHFYSYQLQYFYSGTELECFRHLWCGMWKLNKGEKLCSAIFTAAVHSSWIWPESLKQSYGTKHKYSSESGKCIFLSPPIIYPTTEWPQAASFNGSNTHYY